MNVIKSTRSHVNPVFMPITSSVKMHGKSAREVILSVLSWWNQSYPFFGFSHTLHAHYELMKRMENAFDLNCIIYLQLHAHDKKCKCSDDSHSKMGKAITVFIFLQTFLWPWKWAKVTEICTSVSSLIEKLAYIVSKKREALNCLPRQETRQLPPSNKPSFLKHYFQDHI